MLCGPHVEQLTGTGRLVEINKCHSPSTLRTAFIILLVGPPGDEASHRRADRSFPVGEP